MSSPAAATPLPRRAVSLQSPRPLPSPSSPDSQVEILHTVPSVRIVSFETARATGKSASVGGDGATQDHAAMEGEVGTKDWVSRFERTIAVGPLRVYRAPGSVAFLSCSNALRAILPKSQCWEVELLSIFVLQIRPPQYWRIELPNKTPEEQKWVESFRDVLGKVLLFEKTPCPFKRTFTVHLPEAPKTPVKKKPWRPVERSRTVSSPLVRTECSREDCLASPTPASSSRSAPAPCFAESPTSSLPQTGHLFPEADSSPCKIEPAATHADIEGLPTDAEPADRRISPSEDWTPSLEPSLIESVSVKSIEVGPSLLEESSSLENGNVIHRRQPVLRLRTTDPDNNYTKPAQNANDSATAPDALSIVTPSPSARSSSPLKTTSAVESDYDFSSSVDSFHSVQSWHSPLAPPSPPASGSSSPVLTYPYPHENIALPKRPNHTREVSELTATPQSPRVWDITATPDPHSFRHSISPPPKTPTLIASSGISESSPSDILTPPSYNHNTTLTRATTRHRTTTSSNSRRRELSPLPAAVNLFSPKHRRSRRLQTARHLPTAIIQKTCEILMSPPSHLIQLMLNIAAKIASGEWKGWFSGGEEEVDGSWEFEGEEFMVVGGPDGNGEGTAGQEAWMEEDDFGVSLGARRGRTGTKSKGKSRATGSAGGSWEVD